MSEDTISSVEADVGLGSDAWLVARSAEGGIYHGEPYTIEVVVSADRSGLATTYHVLLQEGVAPQFRPGPANRTVSATLEMSRTDAEGQGGGYNPVVGYMRGSVKTKGATRPLYEFFRLFG